MNLFQLAFVGMVLFVILVILEVITKAYQLIQPSQILQALQDRAVTMFHTLGHILGKWLNFCEVLEWVWKLLLTYLQPFTEAAVDVGGALLRFALSWAYFFVGFFKAHSGEGFLVIMAGLGWYSYHYLSWHYLDTVAVHLFISSGILLVIMWIFPDIAALVANSLLEGLREIFGPLERPEAERHTTESTELPSAPTAGYLSSGDDECEDEPGETEESSTLNPVQHRRKRQPNTFTALELIILKNLKTHDVSNKNQTNICNSSTASTETKSPEAINTPQAETTI